MLREKSYLVIAEARQFNDAVRLIVKKMPGA